MAEKQTSLVGRQMEPVAGALRNLNRQHLRKALTLTTNPVRKLPVPLAQPQGASLRENTPVFQVRESGYFVPQQAPFGSVMPERLYDQESVVVTVDGGRGTFRNRFALDASRRVLYEQQLPFSELPLAFKRLEPATEERGSVAYLSNSWVSNFYHWLFLVLPMLRAYEAAGIDFEHVYVGEKLKPWQAETLKFVGLSEDKILTEPCRAETAHVAVLTRRVPGVPAETIAWVRKTFMNKEPEPGSGTRRLFVGRGQSNTRAMMDEESVADALQREFGFEYVVTSGMTFAEEIELFGQAEAVVGPYGAALTNILFAPVGAKVLELTAYDNDFSIAGCYEEMSAVLCHQHGSIRGEPTPRKRRGVDSDVKVPVERVLREAEKMFP